MGSIDVYPAVKAEVERPRSIRVFRQMNLTDSERHELVYPLRDSGRRPPLICFRLFDPIGRSRYSQSTAAVWPRRTSCSLDPEHRDERRLDALERHEVEHAELLRAGRPDDLPGLDVLRVSGLADLRTRPRGRACTLNNRASSPVPTARPNLLPRRVHPQDGQPTPWPPTIELSPPARRLFPPRAPPFSPAGEPREALVIGRVAACGPPLVEKDGKKIVHTQDKWAVLRKKRLYRHIPFGNNPASRAERRRGQAGSVDEILLVVERYNLMVGVPVL